MATGLVATYPTYPTLQFNIVPSWPPSFQIYDVNAAALSAICGLNVCSQQRATSFWPSTSKPIHLQNLFYADYHQVNDQVFYIPDSEYDPIYDFDFTFYNPLWEWCTRGYFPYKRPSGWNRKAVRVIGKYSDNFWLGQPGWRDGSSPGEWWVSYHGTKRESVPSIVVGGYDINLSVRQAYGPGIYSTPDPKVAEGYGTYFTYNRERYKCILQNRVNPQGTNYVISNLGDGVYYVTPNQHDVRPYGVCIKKV